MGLNNRGGMFRPFKMALQLGGRVPPNLDGLAGPSRGGRSKTVTALVSGEIGAMTVGGLFALFVNSDGQCHRFADGLA